MRSWRRSIHLPAAPALESLIDCQKEKDMRKLTVLWLGVLLVAFLAGPAQATDGILITVDENGHGFLNDQPLNYFIGQDPGPGGLPNALIYSFSLPGQQDAIGLGDVYLREGVEQGWSDLIRFYPVSTSLNYLVFYSDSGPGDTELADVGFPTAFYEYNVTIPELGPEGDNGAYYTPLLGQPPDPGAIYGYDVTYHFISDVPAPPAVWLLGSGLLGLAGLRRRFKK
jgi:hypothetical protein